MKNRKPEQNDHCDQQLLPIDEQLCALLKQRKELSNYNPGEPLCDTKTVVQSPSKKKDTGFEL